MPVKYKGIKIIFGIYTRCQQIGCLFCCLWQVYWREMCSVSSVSLMNICSYTKLRFVV